MIITFVLVCFTYIFFRAESIAHAINFIEAISDNIISYDFFNIKIPKKKIILILIPLLILTEWFQRDKVHGLCLDKINSPLLRGSIYITIFALILLFGATPAPFIYFQF